MATSNNAHQAPMLGEPWVSANLIGNIDPAYNPGPEEDFYVYENRDWLLSTKIPEGYVQYVTLIMDAMTMVQDRCAALLAEGGSDEPDIRSAQNYYALMRDWEMRDKVGVAPLEEMLKRIDAVSSIDELVELLCDPDPLRRVSSLFVVMAMQDMLDGSKYASYTTLSAHFIHEDAGEYANPSQTSQIKARGMHDIFMYVMSKTSLADRAQAIWDASLVYQTQMAAFYPTAADLAVPGARQNSAKAMSKAELAATLKGFPIERALETYGYGDVEEFSLLFPEAAAHVASCFDEEHLEGIKALCMADLINDTAAYLTKDIYDHILIVSTQLMGGTVKNDEEEQCRDAYDRVLKLMPSPVSKLYVSRYANKELQDEIRNLCDEVVRVYKVMLEEEEGWLSEPTRAYAIEKLNSIRFRILFPNKWEDWSGLNIGSAAEGETLWSARKKASDFKQRLARTKVGTKVDPDLMPECIKPSCNYNAAENSVNIHVGFLSDSTFQPQMSFEEKLGGLGMIIGHEISHGFDTQGMLYDKDGVMSNWWTEEDKAAYDARVQKAMDWYENVYKPLGEAMPGIGLRSVGETIADLGALSVCMTIARRTEGFDYDKFFRANARLWRRIDTEYAFKAMLQADEHPMGSIRVDLTLAQCDEFHKTYGVKPGDKMYFAPEDRLRVW